MIINSKEVAVIEEQVTKCLSATSNIVVSNQTEYDEALSVGKKVSALLKVIDTKEKAITKPINDSLKQIRDLFRPYKTQVEEAKTDIASKMSAYINAEESKRKIAEERIAARMEKGTIKEETALRKMTEVELAAPIAGGGMTSVLRIKLIDIKEVPAEYLLINEALIKSDFRAGKVISGIEAYYEKTARL